MDARRQEEGFNASQPSMPDADLQFTSPEVQKNLRRLGRTELLQLLLRLAQENERLQTEITELREKLDSRVLVLREAGSIAEASLKLNGVFEAAQSAADQYLENVRRQESALGSNAIEEQVRAHCEHYVNEARAQAEAYLQGAQLQAEQMLSSVRLAAAYLIQNQDPSPEPPKRRRKCPRPTGSHWKKD